MNGRRSKRERRRVSLAAAPGILARAYRTGKCPNCRRRAPSFVSVYLPDEPGVSFACPRCSETAAAALAVGHSPREAARPVESDAGVPPCAFCGGTAIEWDSELCVLSVEMDGERYSMPGHLAACGECLLVIHDAEALIERSLLEIARCWPAAVPEPGGWFRAETVRVLQEEFLARRQASEGGD